jgi:uncharacterized protein (DUF433 family)
MSDEQLIEKHIRDTNVRPGDARVCETGVPVWVVASFDCHVRGNLSQVAAEYGLSEEAVLAARAYYKSHQREVDARRFAATGSFE